MDAHAQEAYLESQVLTATPQKLRLMLIEGAIRFARQAQECWAEDLESPSAILAVSRCRNVISELHSSVRDDATDLTQKVADIYMFLFRTLTEAQLENEPAKVAQVLEVLEIERETWRKVCAEHPERPDPVQIAKTRPREITSSQPAIAPPAAIQPDNAGGESTGFSLEA